MSRVGKNPIKIPSGVNVTISADSIEVSGKLGKQSFSFSDLISVEKEGDFIVVKPKTLTKQGRMLWGTTQRRVANLVKGVNEGATVNLELSGVGYRAAVQGSNLNIQLGFSHDVLFPIPEGISIKCEKPTAISITGADKQVVGQIAAEIRKYRQPEPYKGKGVIREGEFVVRKEGKKK